MKLVRIFLLIGLAASLGSCGDEDVNSEEIALRLVGQWDVVSESIAGVKFNFTQSNVSFDACNSNGCSGEYYDEDENVFGGFTYNLNDKGTTLSIEDEIEAGLLLGGNWDVLELTNSSLVIEKTEFFINYQYTFAKLQ